MTQQYVIDYVEMCASNPHVLADDLRAYMGITLVQMLLLMDEAEDWIVPTLNNAWKGIQ